MGFVEAYITSAGLFVLAMGLYPLAKLIMRFWGDKIIRFIEGERSLRDCTKEEAELNDIA